MANDVEATTLANLAREWAVRAKVASFGAAILVAAFVAAERFGALFWALGIVGALVTVFAFCAPQRWVRSGVNLMQGW